MPHRAHPHARGDHHALETADAAQAYLALLTLDGPLPSPEELAYRRLLASPTALRNHAEAGQRRYHSHRAPSTPPMALLGERGRTAVLAAALVAGIGVVGASAAAASAHTSAAPTSATQPREIAAPARAAVHSPIDPLTGYPTADEPTDALAGNGDEIGHTTGTAALQAAEAERDANRIGIGDDAPAAAPLNLKARPVPVVPVAQWVNPMPEGAVTSCFGPRWGRLHAGVDLAAPHGTPIRSVGAGVVVSAGLADGYGNAVLIDHGNGYLTHYGHMSEILATVGQRVKAGEQIGKEGSTGRSTGPHLHFEVHEGHYKNPIEPTAWLRAHGVTIPGCTSTTPDDEPADAHNHAH